VGKKLAHSLMWLAALSFVTGCASMTDREKCILLYAAGGGVGAGAIGTGVALSKHNQTGYLEWVVPASVAGGAVLGGIAGYFLCPPPPAPPPPPRLRPQRRRLRPCLQGRRISSTLKATTC
jgi:hypothetical protein